MKKFSNSQEEMQYAVVAELAESFGDIQRKLPEVLEYYTLPHGLTALAGNALATAHDLGDDATLANIGKTIGVPASTMTGIANRLEQMGYVERAQSTVDRRASILSVTTEGARINQVITEEICGDMMPMIYGRYAGDLERFAEMLNDIRRLLDDLIDQHRKAGGQA